jgi:hypothetical protein
LCNIDALPYLCDMKKPVATTEEEKAARRATRKPILSVECVDKEQKDLFDRVADKRGIATAALVRLLLLDEARRLGVE